MAKSISTSRYRIGLSSDQANNFDLEPDGAGGLLIKRASTGAVVFKVGPDNIIREVRPAFAGIRTANKPIGNNAETYADPTTILYNLDGGAGGFNGVTFIAPIPGVFHFDLTIKFDATGGTLGLGEAFIWHNGVRPPAYNGTYQYPDDTAVSATSILSTDILLAAGDQISALGRVVFNTATSAVINKVSFSGHLVRAA